MLSKLLPKLRRMQINSFCASRRTLTVESSEKEDSLVENQTLPKTKKANSEIFQPICPRDDKGFRKPIKMLDDYKRPPFAFDKNLRTSTKKLTETVKLIKNLSVKEALIQLRFHRKKNAELVKETIESAKDEAVYNFNWDERLIGISRIIVNRGKHKKHMIFRARGRINIIKERFSHLLVELKLLEKEPKLKHLLHEQQREEFLKKMEKEALRIKKLPKKYHFGPKFENATQLSKTSVPKKYLDK